MNHYLLALSLLVATACSDQDDSKETPAAELSNPNAPVVPNPVFETRTITVDATQKSVWVHHGLRGDELIPMSKDEPWLIGTSRYMWQTNTGSSGTYEGGAYEVKDQSFESITACESSRFVKDVMVPPLGSVHELITSRWWNIADPVPVPLDTNFVIGRGSECIKLKILSYDKGLYSLKYQRIL